MRRNPDGHRFARNGPASTAFIINHLGFSAAPLRDYLVTRLGEKGFQGLYALLALLTLGVLRTSRE